ncbi:unnamed protein product [Microthlaspi erraticum]|uniref:Uncharacterized protein n=1 Tax=Microthlaspi erraticum TaxID=1685480 RepID=A0A6D2IFU9_9BRAS|nr:unnamed protein product [Microthlaspi erraticum]
MSYRNTDLANPQDQVYPPQQQTRSSQPPQQGYGQKNNYQGRQGTFPGHQMHIPPDFPNQPPQPAPNQEHELKAMLKQLLQGQVDGVVEISKKLADINSKIESLNTRVYSLENHAASSDAAKQGQLPGKAVQNPKEHHKVIFTQEERLDEQADNERAIEELCMLLTNEDNVIADALGVQYVLPEVQATQIAIHKIRFTLNNNKFDRVKLLNMGMVRKTTTKALKGLFLLLQGQADGVVETSKKLAEINSKIENLNRSVYSLENHASSTAAAAKQEQLPGKAIQNPKEQCKVIFTHQEGLEEEEDNERVMEELCMLLNDEDNVVAEALGVQNDQPEVQATPIDIHTSPVELAQQARSAARSSRVLPRSSQAPSVLKPILLDPYQPFDPSSGRLLSQGHKEVIHKFRRDLSEIGVELPTMKSMSEAFQEMQLIQDVLDNKNRVSHLLDISTLQTNLLTSPTFLPKVMNQGKFTLPCTLGHLELDNAVVGSGASINLISLTMVENLGIVGSIAAPYYFNHVWRCKF